jgi:hypothetical protein
VGKTRILGGLLCAVSALVIILHIYFGYYPHRAQISLAFALPVTVGVFVICALGLWLGWIMATTKEVTPPVASEEKEEKKKE